MIHLKNTSTNRLRPTLGGASYDERIGNIERLLRQLIKAAASDLSDISMENLSEYGKKQLDERIRKIVSETNTQ